jgi:hypothetical protein
MMNMKLAQLLEHANEEILKLKSCEPGEVGSSAAADDLSFLDDPIDDINSQPPPVRLSQEEHEQSFQNFNELQKMIFKHVCNTRVFLILFKLHYQSLA